MRTDPLPLAPRLLGALAAVASVALIAPAAGAQSTIHACYVPNSGTVYRIKVADARETCAGKHVEFSWTDQGAPGPQGPQGPQGPIGPEGPQGPAGSAMLTGLLLRSETVTLPADGRFFASCPAGKSVVNFGHSIVAGEPIGTIYNSRPAINGTQIAWGVLGSAGSEWTFYWTCADAAPATVEP